MFKRFLFVLLAAALAAGCGRAAVAPAPASAPRVTIEEHPVVERGIDQPTHFEFNDRIAVSVKEKRARWRSLPHLDRVDNLESANARLAPFGYRLAASANSGFTLYQGDTVVLEGLVDFSRVVTSADGKQFAFVTSQRGQGGLLVRSGKAERWDEGEHLYQSPVFVGNDLVELKTVADAPEQYTVLKGGKVVYRGNLGKWAVDLPVRSLQVWNGKWVLEVKGDVIIDGKSQKLGLNYAELFGWHLLNGKPFFFFRDGGEYGLSYDGQDQGARYDEIVHDKCCEPAAFNPAGNGTMVWFYARKGEVWHYVEAGIYQ